MLHINYAERREKKYTQAYQYIFFICLMYAHTYNK